MINPLSLTYTTLQRFGTLHRRIVKLLCLHSDCISPRWEKPYPISAYLASYLTRILCVALITTRRGTKSIIPICAKEEEPIIAIPIDISIAIAIAIAILEDISSVIDLCLLQIVLRKSFVELSNMTYDSSLGIVKFTYGVDETAYKMPHKIE
ncbi:hypothetical protein Tco_1510668 [Tanacetum coccineum]